METKEELLKDKSRNMVTMASKQEFAAIELQSTLVQNKRSKPVKDQLSAHVASLQDLKKQLVNHITSGCTDFASNKKTYNGLVTLMNKYKQYKAEAKPHIKVSKKKVVAKQSESIDAD